jgi:tetratricopeptide (TPR) repeat protein
MIGESPFKSMILAWTLTVRAIAVPVYAQEAGQDGDVRPADPVVSDAFELQDIPLDDLDASGRRARAQAHFASGITMEAQGEQAEALKQFALALEVDPTNAQLAVRVAEKHIALQKFDEAYEILLPATELEEAEGKAFELLGLIQMARGEADNSLKNFKTALARDPSLIISRSRLVDVHLREGENLDALELVQEAVKATNYALEDMTALIGLYLKFLTIQPNRLNDLGPQLESLVIKSSEVAEEHPALGLAISDVLMLMERFEDAESRLQDLKAYRPPVPMVREKLVDLYLRQGKPEDAVRELTELSEAEPDNPRPQYLLGTLMMEEGKTDEAETHYRKAIEIRSTFEAPYFALAELKLNAGDAREALTVLQQARNQFSKQFILEFYSGVAMSALRRYEPALDFLRSAEEIAAKQDPARLNGFFYFRIGMVLERLGQLEAAEKEFLKCLDKTPDDATTLNYLGYMWADQGKKLDQAYEWISKALEIDPESDAILDSMGWVLFKRGKAEEALPYLEKAESHLEEPDPTILDHLGDVYQALDRREKAVDAFKRSLELEFNEKVFQKWRLLLDKQDIQS